MYVACYNDQEAPQYDNKQQGYPPNVAYAHFTPFSVDIMTTDQASSSEPYSFEAHGSLIVVGMHTWKPNRVTCPDGCGKLVPVDLSTFVSIYRLFMGVKLPA